MKKTWWKEQQAQANQLSVETAIEPALDLLLSEPARRERERYIAELEETIRQTNARIHKRYQDGQQDRDTLVWAEQELDRVKQSA